MDTAQEIRLTKYLLTWRYIRTLSSRISQVAIILRLFTTCDLWPKDSFNSKQMRFPTRSHQKWRTADVENLEMLVNGESESMSLILDRHMMEKMGYSVTPFLAGGRQKKSKWDEKKETKQNIPGCNSLQVWDDKLIEDKVGLRSNVHSEQTWRQGIHIRIVFIAFWRRKQKKAIIAGVTTESFDHLRVIIQIPWCISRGFCHGSSSKARTAKC